MCYFQGALTPQSLCLMAHALARSGQHRRQPELPASLVNK